MKNVTLGLFIAAASVFTAPVWAASSSTCKVIEQRIAESTYNFAKISMDSAATVAAKRAQPAQLYHDVETRRVRQQKAADNLWDLRTEMSNSQCAQAARFRY